MPDAAVEITGVRKRYKRTDALAGIDMTARPGEVTAILGPNGAGKTTLVRAIATLVRPDSGTIRVHGVDVGRQPRHARRLLGLAGQFAAIEPTMTGRENLTMIARLYGRSRSAAREAADDVLSRLGLDDIAERAVHTFSGGMRRRLDLGASLVGSPPLLLLDEPTTGLDPRSRLHLWELIRELVRAGSDVLLTTQYLEEADRLAQQVVILDKGRIVAHGSPAHLKARTGDAVIEVRASTDSLAATAAALRPLTNGQPRIDAVNGTVAIPAPGHTRLLAEAARRLADAGLVVDEVALRHPTLDEVFLALTGTPHQSGLDSRAGEPGGSAA